MIPRHFLGLFCAAALSAALAGNAAAEDKVVKIGAVFPMTGGAASAGVHAKYAIEIALDIINNAHPELGDLPLAKNAGLAGLGGAKVEVVFADNQGSPATGQNQALRLITEDKVVALTGAYQSGITLTSSAIAEKYGIPFVNGESVAANLTERGFKWFFRTTPIASDFAKIYYDFLTDMKASGAKTDNVALVHDNTEYGTSVANTITSAFKEKGQAIALDVAYAVNATDVQSQVLQLKEKKPDVVIMISYTSDAILFAKTMQAQDYKPPMMHRRRCRLFRSVLHQGSRQDLARHVQPLVLERRRARLADRCDRRPLQEEERRRDGRHGRSADAGLLRAGRRDRSRRLDRAGENPGCAEGDRPEAEPAHDRLQGREVRRQGPEHPRLRRHHPAAGRRELRLGVAEGLRREGAGRAL